MPPHYTVVGMNLGMSLCPYLSATQWSKYLDTHPLKTMSILHLERIALFMDKLEVVTLFIYYAWCYVLLKIPY